MIGEKNKIVKYIGDWCPHNAVINSTSENILWIYIHTYLHIYTHTHTRIYIEQRLDLPLYLEDGQTSIQELYYPQLGSIINLYYNNDSGSRK